MPFDSTTTANPAVETLEAALAFLEEGPHRWCQRALARNKSGDCIEHNIHALAYSVCLRGAISRYGLTAKGNTGAFNALQIVTKCQDISRFNDAQTTTYEMILDAFRRAIEIAKET